MRDQFIIVPVGWKPHSFFGYPILGLGSQNRKVGYPKQEYVLSLQVLSGLETR